MATFFKSKMALREVLEDTKPLTQWQAWMDWIGEDEWKQLYRQFLEAIFVPGGLPGKRFWGWKEVHYTGSKDEQTLPFLADIHPDAEYVFLVRSGSTPWRASACDPIAAILPSGSTKAAVSGKR